MKLIKKKNGQAAPSSDDYRPEPIKNGDETKASNAFVGPPVKAAHYQPERNYLAVCCLAAVLILVVGAIFWQYNVHQAKCSRKLLSTAASSIRDERLTRLHDIATDIKQTKGYDGDANCLYVVMADYVYSGDSAGVYRTYDRLKTAYNAKTGFSPALGTDKFSMETFKADVAFFRLQDTELKTNSFGVKQP